MIKKITIALVAIVVLLIAAIAVVSFVSPTDCKVERKITINLNSVATFPRDRTRPMTSDRFALVKMSVIEWEALWGSSIL